MSATERLDAVEARARAATEGPWFQGRAEKIHESTCEVYTRREPEDEGSVDAFPRAYHDADAEFIAHARQDVPALVAALRAVLDLTGGPDDVSTALDSADVYQAIAEHLDADS